MKLSKAFFICIVLLSIAHSRAQSVTGSSSIDIDPSTNTVTATCETDNDDSDYEASVTCVVYDDANNLVASGSMVDHAEEGYAQAVVSFAGVAGTNYTVKATHVAVCNIVDLPEGGGPTYYDDPYNYTYFENGGSAVYPGYYEWYGPGPDTQTRHSNIHVGGTTAGAAISPSVTIRFTGNKSSSDSLTFSSDGICSENLGPIQCSDYFRYSYEGSANVTNAANWTVAQNIVSGRSKGTYNSGETFNIPATPNPDGPSGSFTQEVNSSPVFWIDSPATATSANGDPVNSLTSVNNFSVNVCSKINTSVCGSITYYTEIVVYNGALTASAGGYGSISTNF